MPGRKQHRHSKADMRKARPAIKKRKKAYAKQARKEANRLRALGITAKKGRRKLEIPNMCPFKTALLRKAFEEKEDLKRALEEKEKRQRERRKEQVFKALALSKEDKKLGMRVPRSYKVNTGIEDPQHASIPTSIHQHKALYMRELKQVIHESDVIIEVLDARDPLGCRSAEIERRVLTSQSDLLGGQPKRLILLLNKIDLIPCDTLATWMRILRRKFPVIAFKASTQRQRRKGQSKMPFKNATKDWSKKGRTTSECVGADALMSLLKNYCRIMDIKTQITVGFVGYPNTGKSSVINSLKRAHSAGTSSTPGFTTNLARIKLDANISMIDSPGVVLTNELLNNSDHNGHKVEARLVLRNALKLEQIDVMNACSMILQCIDINELMKVYNLSKRDLCEMFDDTSMTVSESGHRLSMEDISQRFLIALAQKLKHMGAGGRPNIERTAKLVLEDWNSGKIAFYVLPPKEMVEETDRILAEQQQQQSSGSQNMPSTVEFVQSYAAEFDIEALMHQNEKEAMRSVNQAQKQRRKQHLSEPSSSSSSDRTRFVPIQEERFAILSQIQNKEMSDDFEMKNEFDDDDDDSSALLSEDDDSDDLMSGMKSSEVTFGGSGKRRTRKTRAEIMAEEQDGQLDELSELQGRKTFQRKQPDMAYMRQQPAPGAPDEVNDFLSEDVEMS